MLFAGGKDSTYATYEALESGLKVEYLITMISKNPHSLMFHTVNINITRLQAEAMGIERLVYHTLGERDKELEDLKKAIASVRDDVDGVVAGAIASSYQKDRIDRICNELGLVSVAPLWGRDPIELLHEMINAGFKIIVVSVAAQGFDESWLNREIDEETVNELIELNRKYGINLSGEGGEYESLVLDAPFFKERIEPVDAKLIWLGDRGHLLIKKARLMPK